MVQVTTMMQIEMDQVESDNDPNDDDTGEANCWGKVTSSLAKNDDGHPGIGEHSSDPETRRRRQRDT